MSIKGNIKKIGFISFWSLIGTGLLLLIVAAERSRSRKNCKGYEIKIEGEFVDKKDILLNLTRNRTEILKGKSLHRFNLQEMESRLRNEVWIRDAQLFFDNNDVLQVSIQERKPIARIFTSTGNSFYIDSSFHQLPLSDKISARLPVFTSFPGKRVQLKGRDSLLLQHIKQVSWYILNDPFWMAQIAQTDITPTRQFEMIPTIGNHTISFGDGSNYKEKFRRLLIFYQQVVARTGIQKYKRIRVEYDHQVIGVKKEGWISKEDSLRALRNVESMILSARRLQQDSVMSHHQ